MPDLLRYRHIDREEGHVTNFHFRQVQERRLTAGSYFFFQGFHD
jgi:hypothetical protein